MPTEVKTAAKATEIATSFLKQYYAFPRPVSAAREDAVWIVKVDIGLVKKEIAEVKIDASTADIIGYSLPVAKG
ncbi:MAG: hypothetical protein HY665_07970 [Chloroflexi bacterium]|nr:hypothetical protein [Chloroflexota bacterium]